MTQQKNTKRAKTVNPLQPIKFPLRDIIESLGISDASEAGVSLPDEGDDVLSFGISWHCRWLEDNARDAAGRAQIIALARLVHLYPSEVRDIVAALHFHGIRDVESVRYAMAELIFRCMAEVPEFKAALSLLHG